MRYTDHRLERWSVSTVCSAYPSLLPLINLIAESQTMKLHLPNGLRKALLACLAALALPATLPSTLATASGLAAAWIIASQQATAEDVTITKKRDDQNPAGSYNDALQNKNVAGNKWIFNLPLGEFNFGVDNNKQPTHLANFQFEQTLTVNQGYNNVTVTFNGSFTGEEGADLVFAGWGGDNVKNTWMFNGNLSGFKGDILVTGRTLDVVFGINAQMNTGAIKQIKQGEDDGTLNLTLNGQTVTSSEVSVNNLTLNGAMNVGEGSHVTVAGTTTFGGGVTPTLTLGANATVELANIASALKTLTLAEGASLTMKQAISFASSASLTLGEGANVSLSGIAADSPALSTLELGDKAVMELKSGVLKAGSLHTTKVGAVVTIKVGNYVEGSSDPSSSSDPVSLDLIGGVTGEGSLVIDITGLGLRSGYSYTLFSGSKIDWLDLVKGKKCSFIGYDDTNLDIVLESNGEITLKSKANAFTYDGKESLEWGTGKDTGWSDKPQAWNNDGGFNVDFTAAGGSHKVFLAEEKLEAGVLNVAAGTAVYDIANSIANNSAGESAVLSVGRLEVGAGVTMNFGEGTQLNVGYHLALGQGAVLTISENLRFREGAFLYGESGSKIVRAAGVTDPVYLEMYLEGNTNKAFKEYLKEVLVGITMENVGIGKYGEGTLAFMHNLDVGYTGGEDVIDVPLEIAEGAVRLDGSTFTVSEQVTGAGTLQIATASEDEEVMVHLLGGTNMTGTVLLSSWGARLGLGADSIVGGLVDDGAGLIFPDERPRVITSEKEGGNAKLTINVKAGDVQLTQVEISGVDIVKQGEGTQKLNMRFSGGSIAVEGGTLSTKVGDEKWSTLDAVSVSISKGATFHWEGAQEPSGDEPIHGYVSGEVDIQGVFKVGDAINLAQGAAIGESGRITTTRDQGEVCLGDDLVISHAGALGKEENSANGTLKKADLDGTAEHVHLQLLGNNQEYGITSGVWGSGDNTINVDSSLGLYWRGNGGQLKVEGSSLDEVLVGGSGKLWFQGQVALDGELKTAGDYVGEGNVYVHNADGEKLVLKAGGTLKSVLNGGRGGSEDSTGGTYIELGADFEVAGLRIKDAASGELDVGRDSAFEFARYVNALKDAVSLILNVSNNVTLNNELTLKEGVNLEKKGIGTQTVTGAMVAEGDVTVSTGVLELGGVGSEIHGALGGVGKLKVDETGTLTLDGGGNFAGTLEMTDGAAVTVVGRNSATGTGGDLSVGTLSGTGKVTVSSGKLTIGTAEGATLSGLTLGGQDGAAGNLTVKTGSFIVSGTWTWTKGSVLRLETAGQTVELADDLRIAPPTSSDESDDMRLTVDLTEAFLGGDKEGTGHVQLFASGFDKAWKDYFRFTVDGKEVGGEGNYKGLGLNSRGVLRWGIESLYWVVDQPGESLIWDRKTLSFDVDEDGLGKRDTWTEDSDISFVHRDGITDPAHTHGVTLEESIRTGNFHIEGSATYTFNANSEQTTLTVGGDLEVDGGVTLTFKKNVWLDVDGDVSLGRDSKLTLDSDMVFGGKLSGGAGSVVAGSGTVYALWHNGNIDSVTWSDFNGKYGSVRGENVGYGVSMSEEDLDLTIVGPAAPEGNFKVAGAGKTLTFKGGITGSGSITGDGMLKVAEGVTGNTFTGQIKVANFIVESGAQTLGNGAIVSGTITLTGGVLNLGAAASDVLVWENAAVVLAPGNAEGAANTPLLHVVGKADISTLSGTGKVKVDDEATFTLSGTAGEKEIFSGQIDGKTEVRGTLRLGDDAELSKLSVLGTVDVQADSEATVRDLEGNGTIGGAGTLRLTAESGTFGGVVSSRFTYDGGNGGTFTLSGAINSPDVRVESGTLKVSGAETVPGVTLAGGTLDAAKAGLTVSSLTLEGEASGLKVTNNLTVGGVKGEGALGSLNIGAGAKLTVQSGNLTLNGQLSWGSGATLSLGENNSQKFVWGPKFSFGLEDGKLTVFLPGRYLRGLKKDVDSFLELGVEWDAGWADKIDVWTDDERYTYGKEGEEKKKKRLGLRTQDGNLTWTREGVQWNGGTDGVWSDDGDDGAGGWLEVDSVNTHVETDPRGQRVYFIGESGATKTEGVEISENGVTPMNVYVESGNYEFTGGAIGMLGGGVLTVGGDPKGATRLKLSNANTSLPSIELQEDGFLELNNDGALTANTKILFTGGTLEFGDGIKNTDVSSHVATGADGSTEAAKVNVGEGKNVRWGSTEAVVDGNGGLTLILDDEGLVKGGEGNFTLAWKGESAGGASHKGDMTVNAGTLTLEVGGDTTLTGDITGDGTLNVSQGNLTLSGRNIVKNIVLTGSSNTILGSDTALGDKDTVLTLSGGGITGDSETDNTTVNAGTVNVEGSSTVNGTVTFSGTVNGTGTLTAGTGAAVTLSGCLAEFTGTLDTGKDGTITLSKPDTEVKASVAGSGTLDVNSGAAEEGKVITLVEGKLGDDNGGLTVRNSGEGKLVIASASCGDGLSLSFGASAGSIVLGNAGHAVTVNDFRGVTDGTGDVILSNVTLTPADNGGFNKGSAHWFVDTAVPETDAAGARAIAGDPAATVDMGWLSADTLDGIAVNAGGLLTNVSGTYKVGTDRELTLHFTADNMGTDKSKITRGLIKGNEGFNIVFSGGDAEAQGFHLEFDETALLAALRGRSDENTALYLLALGSGTWNAKDVGLQVDWSKSGLLDIVVEDSGFDEDSLWIVGSTKDLYIVMDDEKSDPAVSTSPEILERRLATVVTEGQTLTLNWAGGEGTVHNLLGGPNAALNITDTSGAGLTVTLDNAKQPPSGEISDSRYPDPTPAVGPDTTFDGTIFGDKGVRIRKTGTGTLTVGGDYTLVDGDTRLEAGALRLRGASNSMNSLTFAYSGAGAEGEARGLLLEGGNTSIGSIVEATDAVGTEDNKVSLTNGAELTLTGKSTLASTAITGDEKSTVELGDGAELSLTGEAKIDGIVVEVGDGGALDFGTTTASKLAKLSGTGTLKSAADGKVTGKVTVGGGSFSGTLASSAEGGEAGILAVEEGASFTLDNAKSVASAPDKGMDVQLGKGSGLTVNVGEKSGIASDTLVLGDISIGDGRLTLNFGEKSIGPDFVRGNITSVGSEGSLKFESDGKVTNGTVGTGLTVDSAAWEELLDSVEYGGSGFFRKDVTAGKGEDGKELVLKIEDARRNKLKDALGQEAQGSEKNALAGAAMVWDAFLARPEGETRPGSDFDAMIDNLEARVTSKNTAGLAGTLAAAAGASISTLGPALAEDLHRQLTTIRNRTTTMAYEVGDGAGTRFPLRHAWIDAETGYHELDSDGLAPGYKLTGWGGTVGADFDMSRHLTAGLAFTAMYGDLDADAADSATGDMDTYYLSAFARVSSGSWIHSLVLSGGVADVELNRTVNYGGFSPYRTNGSTDGYALGFLYEVGYTGLVNRQGTAALQPIFNVEVRHIALKGYTETGSDAGVDVDDIDQTVLTFGAGARAQFAVGAHAFNRAAVLETRALLKADMGDRSGSVSNAIIGSATRAEVESAEVGAVGVEAGVGITVPLGTNAGSVFLDGSFEFREGWTSANATLGYRINF